MAVFQSNSLSRKSHGTSSVLVVTMLLLISQASIGFVIHSTNDTPTSRNTLLDYRRQPRPQLHRRFMASNIDEEASNNSNNNKDQDNDNDNVSDSDDEYETVPVLVADVRGIPAGVVIEDLNWRVEKLRLEEANKRRFLKSGPRFLPYEECAKWVQAWGERWISAEEWNDWIATGEKRNSYIPSRPDEYFTRTGHWISWAHFLGVKATDDDGKKSD